MVGSRSRRLITEKLHRGITHSLRISKYLSAISALNFDVGITQISSHLKDDSLLVLYTFD